MASVCQVLTRIRSDRGNNTTPCHTAVPRLSSPGRALTILLKFSGCPSIRALPTEAALEVVGIGRRQAVVAADLDECAVAHVAEQVHHRVLLPLGVRTARRASTALPPPAWLRGRRGVLEEHTARAGQEVIACTLITASACVR
eukprot:scaffold7211_cov71-Phaeocystis_antarctica.AAC.3